MTAVNTETGEIVEPLTREEAERLSMRISLKLDALADAYTGVMPMIREAVERDAHVALGYPSPGAYVSDRFGGALSKLGMDVRREVVRELTAAGMTTRAIAPVVGVSDWTVREDQRTARDLAVEAPSTAPEPSTPLVGLNGKAYTRPEPRPAPTVLDGDRLAKYDAQKRSENLAFAATTLHALTDDAARERMHDAWALGSDGASPAQRAYVTPERLRAIADALNAYAEEMERRHAA